METSGAKPETGRTEAPDADARIFRLGGQWYFSTRDGDIGPFRTREQARREAGAHQTVSRAR
jgi:hypothetical protein